MKLNYENALPMIVKGHCTIEDDLGNVLLDRDNAVHPQNMSRIIARALSNESNNWIHRIAFGNGGTDIDAAQTVTFKTPNDGQPPDIQTWDSRLYNETYSEIIDELSPELGVDPGSADDRVGVRAGGGSFPENDIGLTGVFSTSLGLTSEVEIKVILNPDEPSGQLVNDQTSNVSLDSSFTFDEIGLFTTGAPAKDSTGYQDIDVGDRNSTDATSLEAPDGLSKTGKYDFDIKVDDDGTTSFATISFTVPVGLNNPTYGELCEALNTFDSAWNISQPLPAFSKVAITDTTFGTYPTIEGKQTFGFLRFTSGTSGSSSSIELVDGTLGGDYDPMFASLTGTIVTPAVQGVNKGVQDSPNNSTTEQERMLTHLIFTPVLKAANRTLTITYTLTISVARSAV